MFIQLQHLNLINLLKSLIIRQVSPLHSNCQKKKRLSKIIDTEGKDQRLLYDNNRYRHRYEIYISMCIFSCGIYTTITNVSLKDDKNVTCII